MTTKFIDVTGKTEDEAIGKALAQLGLERDVFSLSFWGCFLGFRGSRSRCSAARFLASSWRSFRDASRAASRSSSSSFFQF